MFDVHSGRAPLASVEGGASYDDVARALRDVIGDPPTPVVTSVVFLDDHEAVVRFHVGSTALTGEAIAENGHWRVAAPTFCASVVEVFAEVVPERDHDRHRDRGRDGVGEQELPERHARGAGEKKDRRAQDRRVAADHDGEKPVLREVLAQLFLPLG